MKLNLLKVNTPQIQNYFCAKLGVNRYLNLICKQSDWTDSE